MFKNMVFLVLELIHVKQMLWLVKTVHVAHMKTVNSFAPYPYGGRSQTEMISLVTNNYKNVFHEK